MKFIKCRSRGTYINVDMIEVIEIFPATEQVPCGIVVTLPGNRKYTISLFGSEAEAEQYLLEYLGITGEPILVRG